MADFSIFDDSICGNLHGDGHREASCSEAADRVLRIALDDELLIAWGAVVSQRAGTRLEEFHAIGSSYVLLFVNRGTLRVSIDGETHTASKGQTLLIWPGEKCVGVEPHETDLLCQWLSFAVRHTRRRGKRIGIEIPRTSSVSDPGMVSELFRLLTEEYHKQQPRNASGVALSSQESQLLLLSLLFRLKPAPSQEPQASNALTVLAERARDYMRANPAKPYTIADLAKLLECSVGYLRTAFRHTYGHSPSKYLLTTRMHLARYLLITSRLTINQVAEECGYTDPGYFARVFMRANGVTPSQYRVLHSHQYMTQGI